MLVLPREVELEAERPAGDANDAMAFAFRYRTSRD